MQAYFTNLFNYDYHTNQTMIKATINAGSPAQAVKLLAHLLGAQQVWLKRCLEPDTQNGPIWPEWPIELLAEINEQNHAAWISFLQNEINFDRNISYRNSKGDAFTDNLTHILAHLINHGTHHRAQVGQQLKFAGAATLPITDYIFYLRSQNK